MANELVIHHPTGATLYALLFDATGQIYNGSTFGAPSSASWTDYGIAMSEAATATGIYRADMPAVAAGAYGWVVRKQAGGSPAVGDIAVGAGSIRWTGTAEEAVPAAVNVTLWRGSQPANLASSGYVESKLADGVAHGGESAELTLKKAILYNPEFGGIALLLSGDNVNGGRGLRIVGGWKAIEVDGDIDATLGGLTADDVLDEVVEESYTLRQMMRIVFAALAGKSTGGGSTGIAFRDVADTKDRITATVDADGNRTAMTLDAT